MFPILYYKYDCNIVCHKHFIMIHSLVGRLDYHEAIVSITLGYHKALIFSLLCYQCMNCYTCKWYTNFFLILSFHFWCLMFSSVQFSFSVCPTLCDPMNHSTPGLPVHHHLPEFTQTLTCKTLIVFYII